LDSLQTPPMKRAVQNWTMGGLSSSIPRDLIIRNLREHKTRLERWGVNRWSESRLPSRRDYARFGIIEQWTSNPLASSQWNELQLSLEIRRHHLKLFNI
jgi:hypothetical protein